MIARPPTAAPAIIPVSGEVAVTVRMVDMVEEEEEEVRVVVVMTEEVGVVVVETEVVGECS